MSNSWNPIDQAKYNLLLINILSQDDLGKHSAAGTFSNMGQYYIAGYLEKHGYQARIVTAHRNVCMDIITGELNSGVCVLGFYAIASNIIHVNNAVKQIKALNSNVTIIIGGPEAAGLSEDYMRECGCDYLIEGEGEVSVCDLLSHIYLGKPELSAIPNLKYFIGSEYHANNVENKLGDLDSLPFPNKKFDLLPQKRIESSMSIMTGRGCPNKCAFCYDGAATQKVRFRSLDNVFIEIDMALKDNPNIKTLYVYDDTFTINYDRLIEFCRRIKEYKLNWMCEAHIKNLYQHSDLISEMVNAGMVAMEVGIESGSNTVLQGFRKDITTDMVLSVIEACKKAGTHSVIGNIIFGGAFETQQTIEESKVFCSEALAVGRGMFSVYTRYLSMYPNTAITRNPSAFGLQRIKQKQAYRRQGQLYDEPELLPEGMSMDQFVNEKNDFDRYLNEQYFRQAILSTEEDIYQTFFRYNTSASLPSNRWKNTYQSIPHIKRFVENYISDRLSIGKYYPIITTNSTRMISETNNMVMDDDFQQILYMCNGSMTCDEITEKLHLKHGDAACIFSKLFKHLLIYYSKL